MNAGQPSVIPVLRSQTKPWGKVVSQSTLTRELWVQGEILPQYSGYEWGKMPGINLWLPPARTYVDKSSPLKDVFPVVLPPPLQAQSCPCRC